MPSAGGRVRRPPTRLAEQPAQQSAYEQKAAAARVAKARRTSSARTARAAAAPASQPSSSELYNQLFVGLEAGDDDAAAAAAQGLFGGGEVGAPPLSASRSRTRGGTAVRGEAC